MPLMFQANTLLMQWCLDCHRNPEDALRPMEEGFQHGLEAPAKQAEIGKQLGDGTKYSDDGRADQLLDVSSLMDGMSDHERQIRSRRNHHAHSGHRARMPRADHAGAWIWPRFAKAAGKNRQAILADAGRAGAAIRILRICCTANFPASRFRVGRIGRPPRLSEIDGRFAGPGRTVRLRPPPEQHDCSVREAAGRPDSRQAPAVRHGDAIWRGCGRRAGGKPRRAAHKNRRAIRIIRRASARRRDCAGFDPESCTTRIARKRRVARWRDSIPGRRFWMRRRRCRRTVKSHEWRGFPHSDRHDHFPDARRANQSVADALSRRRSGISGNRPSATARAKAQSWRSAAM